MSTTTAMMAAGPSIPSVAPSTSTTAVPSSTISISNSDSRSTTNSDTNTSGAGPATATAPNLSTISPSLRARFVEEINRKKPSEEDVTIWNQHCLSMICTYCSNAGHSKCLPAEGIKSVRCRVCNDRRGTCSKVRDELHFRVKRLLEIDDSVFQLLYESTGGASIHAAVKRKGGNNGNGGDDDSPSKSLRKRSSTAAIVDGVLQLEPSKAPTDHRKSKSKSKRKEGSKEDRDGTVSDASSDLSSLCDCDHEQRLSSALEEVKRLKLELASAKSAATSSQSSSSPNLTADLTAAQNELTRTKAAKEEVEKKLGQTTQTLEKVLGQVQPLTQEAVRIKKDNDELRKRLRELEGIKTKYLELAGAAKPSKAADQDPGKEALAKALDRAQKAEEEAEKANTRVIEIQTKTVELEAELTKVTVALGKAEEECKKVTEALGKSEEECKKATIALGKSEEEYQALRDEKAALEEDLGNAKATLEERDEHEQQREQERMEASEGIAEEMQNQNDKLHAMVLLLKGQLSRSTNALKEANGKLAQHAQLQVYGPSLNHEVAELRRKCLELNDTLEKERKAMAGDSVEKQNESVNENENVKENVKENAKEKQNENENENEDVIMNEVEDQDQRKKTPVYGPDTYDTFLTKETLGDESTSSGPSTEQTQSQPQPQPEAESSSQPRSQSQSPTQSQVDPSSHKPDGADSSSSNSTPTTSSPSPTDELSKLKADSATLQSTITSLQITKSELQTDFESLKREHDIHMVAFKTQIKELLTLKTANAELQIKIDRLEEEGSETSTDSLEKLKNAHDEITNLQIEVRSLEKERERWERHREKYERDKEKDSEKVKEMKRVLTEMETKYERSVRDGKEPNRDRDKGKEVDYQHLPRSSGRGTLEDEEDGNSLYSVSSSTQNPAAALQEAKREILKLKDDLEYLRNHRDFLSSKLTARDTEHAVSLQKDVVEHTNLHLLNRMVLQAKADFTSRRITRSQIIDTCDTLSAQLLQVAARRLDKLEGADGERVGFKGIMDLMDTASVVSSGLRWNGVPAHNRSLSSASGSGSAARRELAPERSGGSRRREEDVDSQEEDASEPPLKKRKVPR
ncbi:hypothetical protein D9758_013171 [Tetrapyrgos nigripes]|uniref:Uncharacterized protein n=1 Tax=Tetrapyrgos nigripes TaxID=182062 RepID=A0A8H5CF32_9AGAR|nr:hypothetical protein D9758_013171 [Tetrapyrgos nigripes]